jgi:hypothetical protein
MQDYNKNIAKRIMKSDYGMIENMPQPDALSTFQRERMYGGKRVRAHPLAGYTAYSEDPGTLTVTGPTLLNRTFNENVNEADSESDEDDPEIKMGGMRKPRLTNAIKQRILNQHPELMQIHLSGGAINWSKIWKGIKDVGAFVSKAAPIVSSLAPEEYRDTINKTGEISGKISGMGRKPRLTNAIKQRILSQHPELMQVHLSGGAINWSKIWKGIKDVGAFVSKAAPIVSSLAPEEYRDTINKTGDISGKISGMGRKPRGRPPKHYVHHDIRMVEPVERNHKLDGSGFWQDFGHGFKTGFKGANKVASKVLPIVSIFQPELAPLAAASVAANAAMGGKRKSRKIGGASELYPPAVMKGGKKPPSARGLLIKKVMAQRKCSLPEASKYIKQNNLM